MYEKGSVNRITSSDGERIVVMNNIKLAGANRENVAEAGSKKEIKMFNQVKRMVNMPDTSFNQLAKAIMKKEGGKVENVMNQIYKERES